MRDVTLTLGIAGALLVSAPIARTAETVRTVYFSASDDKGAFITDLAAADLTVKEDGKARPIASVQLATAPMHIAIFVDDAGTGAFQASVADFLERMYGHAQFAISTLNPQPLQLTDFTDDRSALQAALARLTQRGRISVDGDQMVDAVDRAAIDLKKRGVARPVIVVLTVSGETTFADHGPAALDNLKNSGTGLNVFHISGLGLGRVLGDGPKQSGGVTVQANGGVVLTSVLSKVADHLLHQYVLTYTLPDGVKPSERFQLATGRKGVTLTAPTRIADK
jgi:hypothetical protein